MSGLPRTSPFADPGCWCKHCATRKLVRMIMSVVPLAAAEQRGHDRGYRKGEADAYWLYAMSPWRD